MPLLTSFPFSQGGIPKATVTGTTGSPTVDTTSRPGKTIYSFTGSGSITFGQAGTCEVLVVGGGAGGGDGAGGVVYGKGGGGAGGVVYNANAYVTSSTMTVSVGAGGASTTPYANPSSLAISTSPIVFALPGGGNNLLQASYPLFGGNGASSAGQLGTPDTSTALAVTTVPFTQGNTGGKRNAAGTDGGGCGGGGAGAVGADSTNLAGSNGGAGISNSITGSSVTYGGGGGGGGSSVGGVSNSGGAGGTGGGGNGGGGGVYNPSTGGVTGGGPGSNGTANTGGGGGGGGSSYSSGNGGSGIVIVVVG